MRSAITTRCCHSVCTAPPAFSFGAPSPPTPRKKAMRVFVTRCLGYGRGSGSSETYSIGIVRQHTPLPGAPFSHAHTHTHSRTATTQRGEATRPRYEPGQYMGEKNVLRSKCHESVREPCALKSPTQTHTHWQQWCDADGDDGLHVHSLLVLQKRSKQSRMVRMNTDACGSLSPRRTIKRQTALKSKAHTLHLFNW